MTSARRATLAGVAGLVLAVLPTTSADADTAIKRYEHSTDIYCDTRTEDGWTVMAGANRNISDEGLRTYAVAEVYSEDGSVDAYGQADDIVFADGRIEAEVELYTHDDVLFGTAHLVGSYAIGEAEVWRGRPLKLLGNQFMVRKTALAPVSIEWQTLDVAGVDIVVDGEPVRDLACDAYDLDLNDTITDPHRLSVAFEEYRLAGPCSPAPIEDVAIIPSEGGLSVLFFGPDGAVGDTNLDVTNSGPQLLQWFLPETEEPVYADITAAFTKTGTPSTSTTTEKGRTVRTTVQPLEMAFTLGLPDGGSVTASCVVEKVSNRIVVEPVD